MGGREGEEQKEGIRGEWKSGKERSRRRKGNRTGGREGTGRRKGRSRRRSGRRKFVMLRNEG